ncbi:MAG: hypothetical protein P4M09_20520 [Devosia sp.]|nr:hypothetical protein [Devosia sp.]
MIIDERELINKAIDDAISRRTGVDEEIVARRRELHAFDLYEAAKSGKAVAARTAPPTRTARGARSEVLLTLIASGSGLTRAQILEDVGMRGKNAGPAEGRVSGDDHVGGLAMPP